MRHAPDRIRFDDAIWQTRDPKGRGMEVQRFAKNVNWCLGADVPLAPAVLCEVTEEFLDGIQWLYEMTTQGLIYPDLHGWDHGPYHTRTQAEVEEHLDKAQIWFKSNLGVPAIRWVTPHGSDSIAMQAAAAKYDLVIETTDYPVVDQKVLDSKLRTTGDLACLDDIVVMNHWWEKGLRLYRIAKIIEHQGIPEAIEATRSALKPKEHKACWGDEWLVWGAP